MRSTISQSQYLFLAEATAWRYRACGRYAHGFVLGKLKHDPVYRALLALPCWTEPGLIVDLGCGHGIIPALLATAAALNLLPGGRVLVPGVWGLERDPAAAAAARSALAGAGDVVVGDVRIAVVPRCRVVLLIDLLYHLDPVAQQELLHKVHDVLDPGGSLIIREADAGAGWRFGMTWLAEWLRNLGRGTPFRRRHYRRSDEWMKLLEGLGFHVESQSMSEGTPFANDLLIATKTG
ncbi:MAG: class I SAM-dependent methyltransferase [Methylococcaceae bacterium]|nr:class I SAM-dependent methyltransferase [Methylococcaceae bacterium]